MGEPTPRFWEIFLELFEGLPRQGPGSRDCAERALALCAGLPASPRVVDLGCGTGAQTLYLAELAAGRILAVDNHAPSIERLRTSVRARGLEDRIEAIVADMGDLPLAPASCDLIWSEGALYNLGVARALCTCRELLRPGGCLVFTEPVWRVEEPPAAVREVFDAEYPGMGRAEDVVETIEARGLALLGHFTLPDEAWWDDFYTPMERRIAELRQARAGDGEALAVLDQLAGEPDLHRRFSHTYAYEFFVARRPATG